MGIARSFLKALPNQAIGYLDSRFNQYENVIQLQIHDCLCRLFRHNEHRITLTRLSLVIQFKPDLS